MFSALPFLLAVLPISVQGTADQPTAAAQDDPYLWLEDVDGDKVLDWVREFNKKSTEKLEAVPEFEPINKRCLEIYNSNERIPYVAMRKAYLYNFWRDEKNVRGLLRRTTMEEYRKDKPDWETVLDIDELAEKENENWVYKGANFLYPGYDRCLVSLSRGGADATVMREFDPVKKEFVKDGFYLPEDKSSLDWIDRDHVYVGTDFGEGSLTDSGYPRIAKLWTRGTPLSQSKLIYEGQKEDVSAFAYTLHTPSDDYSFAGRSPSFFTQELYCIRKSRLEKVDIPEDADFESIFKRQMLVRLKTDWKPQDKNYLAGSLIAIDFEKFMAGDRAFEVLFLPSERISLAGVNRTKNLLLVTVLDNVAGVLYEYRFDGGKWKRKLVDTPKLGSLSAWGALDSDVYFTNYTDYLTPSTLYLTDESGHAEIIKQLPNFFNADPFEVKRFEAESADGTMIPYFIVQPKDLKLNSQNPTLLTGYGGFESSSTPYYSATVGTAWLERGGVYVVANIRGGGEFGPKWHQAAMKKNRHKAFDDFIAVAEDLIRRRVTSPRHLGIRGGSNGGLLVGAVFTRRPELFNAVVCGAPLLDMRRYHKLLAGASWMEEYGDPDDEGMWNYLKTYSPYHNVRKDVKYPKVLFTTSTRDDRVHPGHARKMVAKMTELGHDVYYYENIEGGHGGSANNEQAAYVNALSYAYLLDQLR